MPNMPGKYQDGRDGARPADWRILERPLGFLFPCLGSAGQRRSFGAILSSLRHPLGSGNARMSGIVAAALQ